MSNSPAAVAPSPKPGIHWWQTALAAVWLTGFAYCFYQFDLPNSNPKVNRTQIWMQLPALLINAVDPPEPAAKDLEARQLWKQAGWRYWPQRFGLYAVSAAILAGAWAWGNLLLRILRIPLLCWTLDRTFFALAAGLSVVSLLTLGCGLSGNLRPTTLGWLLGGAVFFEGIARLFTFGSAELGRIGNGLSLLNPRRGWPLLAFLPFVMCYIGGAFLPEVDFDVKEYHFGGPKEWYLASQISFLPHNVYTSFPFLTEMLTLLGMVLYGDWYWGALAGKGVLMAFGPLTALGIYVAGRRWFSARAGAWAAFIHLSTPWIYRISIIAYVEGGLACYLFASLMVVMLYLDRETQVPSPDFPDEVPDRRASWAILAGFLSGSAMACKYPGVVSVVIPCGLILVWNAWKYSIDKAVVEPSRRRATWYGTLFSIGVFLAMGPWLLKNLVETGNPVYPLLYNVFGGVDWNAELNDKFRRGHSPDHYQLLDLAEKVKDVALKSDWLSPLLFGLAPMAFFAMSRRRVAWLWLFVIYQFGIWWLLTHRIDRFWVPLIPVVSLLAGVGAAWNEHRIWRWVIRIAVGLAATFNVAFMTSSLCGYNAYLLDLNRAAEQTAQITSPEIVLLNAQLPAGSKVLCVGEAELFDARFPYVYNTVFDKSVFEEWCGVAGFTGVSADRPLKSSEEIRRIFREQGITHVLVNWQEILRYRLTYGYTDFVTPQRFEQLRAQGILGTSMPVPGVQFLESMPANAQTEVKRWAPELIQMRDGTAAFRTFDVFPVHP